MAKETEQVEKTTSIKKTKTKKGWKLAKSLLVFAVFIGLVGVVGYLYKQNNDLKKNPVFSQEAQQKEEERIIAAVSKLFSVPNDEKPTLAYVNDKDKLSVTYKDQPFFQKAENGDYLLLYNNAKLAILYRPSEDRIIDSRPFTIDNSGSLSVAIIGPEAIRNKTEESLKASYSNEVTVSSKSDAKNAYTGVLVVDVSGKYSDQAKKIASTLKGKVGNLPEGESKPEGADMVIIVGVPTATTPGQ